MILYVLVAILSVFIQTGVYGQSDFSNFFKKCEKFPADKHIQEIYLRTIQLMGLEPNSAPPLYQPSNDLLATATHHCSAGTYWHHNVITVSKGASHLKRESIEYMLRHELGHFLDFTKNKSSCDQINSILQNYALFVYSISALCGLTTIKEVYDKGYFGINSFKAFCVMFLMKSFGTPSYYQLRENLADAIAVTSVGGSKEGIIKFFHEDMTSNTSYHEASQLLYKEIEKINLPGSMNSFEKITRPLTSYFSSIWYPDDDHAPAQERIARADYYEKKYPQKIISFDNDTMMQLTKDSFDYNKTQRRLALATCGLILISVLANKKRIEKITDYIQTTRFARQFNWIKLKTSPITNWIQKRFIDKDASYEHGKHMNRKKILAFQIWTLLGTCGYGYATNLNLPNSVLWSIIPLAFVTALTADNDYD